MSATHTRWVPDRWDENGLPHRAMIDKTHPIPSGMDDLPDVTHDDLDEWLDSRTRWAWTFATTMPDAPHYYVVRGKTVPTRAYRTAFALIATFGEDDDYYGHKRVYLYNRDRTQRWWVMSDYPSRSRILNTAHLDDQPGEEWP